MLYAFGCTPRLGEMIMIAGRDGSQKSGFALWLTTQWDLPTMYLSADMSGFQASTRLACMKMGYKVGQVEAILQGPDDEARQEILRALARIKTTFSFDSPITARQVEAELGAYVELWDAWPKVIVIDNLMDVEGGEADYASQQAIMQDLDSLKRDTGSTIMVLHHATGKTNRAREDPGWPPMKADIKNGMAEKPETIFGVGLDPLTLEFKIAVLKNRNGPQDPNADRPVVIQADPVHTRFYPK